MKCVHSNADYRKKIGETSMGNKRRFIKGHEYPSELCKSPIYRIWLNMKTRCNNHKASGYSRYGGRGITYQDSWKYFDNFYRDMSPTYKAGLTIDRIDNNGNYTKENCRWSDVVTQANNRRNSRYFTIKGITKTLAEWIKTSSIKSSTVRQRLYCYGWSVEKALSF